MRFHKIKLSSTLLKLAYTLVDVETTGDLVIPDTRSFEFPFVVSKLDTIPKGKVLEVGCTARTNCLPAILAWQGWDVYGLDLREFKLRHPRFNFIQGDITNTKFPDNFFDCVYEVSALEHVGRSGRYGVEIEDIDGDIKAVKEISRILKSEGRLLVIEAFGMQEEIIKPMGRIYDKRRLERLFSEYRLLEANYYIYDREGYWEMSNEENAAQIGSKKYNEAFILLELQHLKDKNT